MEKTIRIDGKDVSFKSTAALPLLYRRMYNRDVMVEMAELSEDFKKSSVEASTLSISSLEIFERLAHVMNVHADPEAPKELEAWLEQFSTFSIYEVLPQILDLWQLNQVTLNKPRKK